MEHFYVELLLLLSLFAKFTKRCFKLKPRDDIPLPVTVPVAALCFVVSAGTLIARGDLNSTAL